MSALHAAPTAPARRAVRDLNGRWHRAALLVFVATVSTHWLEHLVQAVQVWLFQVPRRDALGVLGTVWPWLVQSEGLHYAYAVVTIVPLLALAPAFTRRSRRWWVAAVVLQTWHLLEHSFLLYQATTGSHLFGRPVPTSVLQMVVPRMELHLFYNVAVTIPIMVSMALHRRSPQALTCGCAKTHAAAPAPARSV